MKSSSALSGSEAEIIDSEIPRGKILLVDDDPDLSSSLCDLLQPEGYEVTVANGIESARRAAAAFDPDIALLDVKLGSANGIDLIATLKRQRPELACVVMTGHANTEIAVRALREGADDFLVKPVDPLSLIRTLNRCRQHQRLERENRDVMVAIRNSEEHTRAVMENVADAVVTVDSTGIIDSVNAAALELFGYDTDELLGESVSRLAVEEDRELHNGYIQSYLNGGDGNVIGKGTRSVRGLRKDGTLLDLELAVSEAQIGSQRMFIGAVRDVSERKRMEALLRQSQKMEAVGQLTGGVAHDFNNLLGVILGNTELLEDSVGADNPHVRAVIRAAERGSELTHRLLAFSRLQPLQANTLDPVQLLGNMSDLLTRTLADTIEVALEAGGGIWPVKVDSAQMEGALLNLAINAGQSMPEGGKLTFNISNETVDAQAAAKAVDAVPGDYVALAVTDTGSGMAPNVLARAFDPFFTTKPVGEGSGLGLSMVYGFARQSGGFATIESELGRGATVRIFLPRAEAESVDAEIGTQADAPRGNGETILVLEDDPEILNLAVTLLDGLGYEVLSAPDGKHALEILRATPGIDLVLSDVMLPGGLLGPEVVQRAKQARPDLRVLFMSGYADAEAAGSGLLEEGAKVLTKPFRRYDLACQVRVALAGTSAAGPVG